MALLYPGDGIDLDTEPDDFYVAAGWVADAAGSKTLRTTAICLEPSDDPLALTYESANGSIGSGVFSGGGSESCSIGEVTGGGFRANAAIEDLELEEVSPGFDGDKLNSDRINSGYTKRNAAMNYTTFAICSTDNLKQVVKSDVVFEGNKTIKVACPKNRRVVGGGFGRFPADTIASQPYDSKDKGKAPDDGWKMTIHSGTGAQAMYAWASCLK